jgi:hypothetical protein
MRLTRSPATRVLALVGALGAAPAIGASDAVSPCSAGMAFLAGATDPRGAAGFCLDLNEVSIKDYAACVRKGACTKPVAYDAHDATDAFRAFCNWQHPGGHEAHPVNCVTFAQAKAYCAQRSARLPTDVEWRWAASNGGRTRYPWGNARPDASRANGCGRECAEAVRATAHRMDVRAQYAGSDGFGGTAPVGSFPRGDSRASVHDLAGNVAEFVVPVASPASTGDLVAGGGFLAQDARLMSPDKQVRTAWSGATSPDVGFRCAAAR